MGLAKLGYILRALVIWHVVLQMGQTFRLCTKNIS